MNADEAKSAIMAARRRDLAGGPPHIQQSLLAELIQQPDVEWIDELTERLSDAESNVRYLACVALIRLGAPAKRTLCSAIASHPDVAVRIAAVSAVTGEGEEARWALDPLRAALDGTDPQLRLHAAAALARLGEPAIPTLLNALSSPDIQTQTWAARSLGWIGPAAQPAVARLEELAATAEPPLQLIACSSVAKITRDPMRAFGCLVDAANRPQAPVRQLAVEQIGELGELGLVAVGQLAVRLADIDEDVACAAALAIARVRANEPDIIEALVSALANQTTQRRCHLLIALANLGPDARQALPVIRSLENDADPRVAAAAKAAVAALASGEPDV